MIAVEGASLHLMQQVFRHVLDAFAHPGTVQRLPAELSRDDGSLAFGAPLETLVRLFVDQAVSFCVQDVAPDAAERFLVSETHAARASCREADFVIVPVRADAQIVRSAVLEASQGALASPEKGATVLMGCARIEAAGQRAGASLPVVEVRGPGVADVNRFGIDRIAWADARADRGDEYPCGIEIVLVDDEGDLVAIPRSAHLVVDGREC